MNDDLGLTRRSLSHKERPKYSELESSGSDSSLSSSTSKRHDSDGSSFNSNDSINDDAHYGLYESDPRHDAQKSGRLALDESTRGVRPEPKKKLSSPLAKHDLELKLRQAMSSKQLSEGTKSVGQEKEPDDTKRKKKRKKGKGIAVSDPEDDGPELSPSEKKKRARRRERAARRRRKHKKLMKIIKEREEQARKEHAVDCATWGCTCKVK